MPQFSYADAMNPDLNGGTDLNTALDSLEQALNSNHSGASRPAYLQANGVYVKTVSATQHEYTYYDGVGDILLFTVNPAANTVAFSMNVKQVIEASAGAEMFTLKDTGGVGSAANPYMTFKDSANANRGMVGMFHNNNDDVFLNSFNAGVRLYANNALKLQITTGGQTIIYGEDTNAVKLNLGAVGQSSVDTFINFRDENASLNRNFGWQAFRNAFILQDSSGGFNEVAHAGNVTTLYEENPNEITIADDAVGVITPPNFGGLLVVIARGETNSPLVRHNFFGYYDVGSSRAMFHNNTSAPMSLNTTVSTNSHHGTTGPDGNVSISARSSAIQIENRSGSSITFQYRFL